MNHTGLCSGAEAVLVRLLQGALQRGWEVTSAAPDGPIAGRLADESIERTRLPELKLPAGPRLFAAAVLAARWPRAALRLNRIARRADVLVANGLLALPALRLARIRTPIVWLVHDVIHQAEWLALLRICRPVITLAIAPSEAVARPLREHGLNVRVIRNGTPWPVAPARPRSGKTVIIGATALLTSWKGQDVLLEAVARLSRRDVIVELLGGSFPKDAPYVQRLRRRAAAPDLDGRVRFLGQVDDPIERMRDWSIAVIASVDPEAAPLALLEAMSIGLPLVITDHGGGPEVLNDGGLLVPPGDPDGLAAAIERLLDDPDLQASCGAAGRRAIRDGLTLDTQQDNLVRMLGEVADASQSRPKVLKHTNE